MLDKCATLTTIPGPTAKGVSVTMENKCAVYSTMHANLPSWGITGNGSEEITVRNSSLGCTDSSFTFLSEFPNRRNI